MQKKIILATVAPVGLFLILFFLVANSSIKTYDFKRNYRSISFNTTHTVPNPGIYQMKLHKGKLFGTNFQAIFSVDLGSMERVFLSEVIPQSIVGWGFYHDTVLACLSNTRAIYFIDSEKKFRLYHLFPFHIDKIFIANDSIILLKAYDSSLVDYDYYIYNFNDHSTVPLKSDFKKVRDGGFADDGEFIDFPEKVIQYRVNRGGFSVFYKQTMTFSPFISTIDGNNALPPVIHFSSTGFRLDKKALRTTLTGCATDSAFFLFSNAFNKREYYGGSYKSESPVDVYDNMTFLYQYSFSLPKNSYKDGALISAIVYEKHLVIIYLRKIAIISI